MSKFKRRKKFGDKYYTLKRGVLTKSRAVQSAKAHRRIGHKARVLKNKAGYAVYVHS